MPTNKLDTILETVYDEGLSEGYYAGGPETTAKERRQFLEEAKQAIEAYILDEIIGENEPVKNKTPHLGYKSNRNLIESRNKLRDKQRGLLK